MKTLIKRLNKQTNEIPVFFATDDNYMPFLVVTLESITRNMNKNFNYIFYILNHGISDKYKALVEKYNTTNSKVVFVNVAEKLAKTGNLLHTRDYYSKTTYYRLFIPTMFPEYDKALYLDCDIAVNGDISELYNKDLGTNLLGAVTEQAVMETPEFLAYATDFLGIKKGNYFNAGILLMNLNELRKMNFEQKFINLLSSFTFNVAQDQDYLNVICAGRVTYLEHSWNKSPITSEGLTSETVKLAHYILSFKPWHHDNILFGDLFWKYAELAGVKEMITEIKNNYTEEQKANEAVCGARLIKIADYQSKLDVKFKDLMENGEIDKNTYLKVDRKTNLMEKLLKLMNLA